MTTSDHLAPALVERILERLGLSMPPAPTLGMQEELVRRLPLDRPPPPPPWSQTAQTAMGSS